MDSNRWAKARGWLRRACTLSLAAVLWSVAPVAWSQASSDVPANRWVFQTSVYTRHFSYDPRHNDHQALMDLEYWREDNWLAGASWFRNSFKQPTQYLYVGKLWRPFDTQPQVYVKLTGGVIHGYKDEFRDKIPFNKSGYAPGIIPSIGYSGRRFTGEFVLFGTSGVMFTFGVFLN
jgi:hypothetical protein